jgi:branched-chain amino acid transport system substrate-binding protein
VRAAEELVTRKGRCADRPVLSNITLTDPCQAEKVFFLAAEPLTDKIVWQNGNRYTFRLRTPTYYAVAMLVPEGSHEESATWCPPNYEYVGCRQSSKRCSAAAQPDVEFVVEQAPPLGKVDLAAWYRR